MALERKAETYDNFDTLYRAPSWKPLDRPALEKFREHMKKYLTLRKNPFVEGADIEVYDVQQYLKDERAVNERGEVLLSNYKPGKWSNGRLVSPTDCDPIPYELAMAKFDQLIRYLGFLKQASGSKFAQYNEMSKQITERARV